MLFSNAGKSSFQSRSHSQSPIQQSFPSTSSPQSHQPQVPFVQAMSLPPAAVAVGTFTLENKNKSKSSMSQKRLTQSWIDRDLLFEAGLKMAKDKKKSLPMTFIPAHVVLKNWADAHRKLPTPSEQETLAMRTGWTMERVLEFVKQAQLEYKLRQNKIEEELEMEFDVSDKYKKSPTVRPQNPDSAAFTFTSAFILQPKQQHTGLHPVSPAQICTPTTSHEPRMEWPNF